jgi:hypothetical protein
MALEGAGVEAGKSHVGAMEGWIRARTILADGDCLANEDTADAARIVDDRLKELIRKKPEEEPTDEPTDEPITEPTQQPIEPGETPSGSYAW